MALPSVLQPYREHQGETRRATGSGEDAHFTAHWLESQIEWITAHRGRTAIGGVGEHLLPLRQSGVHGWDRLEPLLGASGLVQPRVTIGRIAPEETRQVRDPGDVNRGAIERFDERVG